MKFSIYDICEKKSVKASQLKHHKQVEYDGKTYKCVPSSVEHSPKHCFKIILELYMRESLNVIFAIGGSHQITT